MPTYENRRTNWSSYVTNQRRKQGNWDRWLESEEQGWDKTARSSAAGATSQAPGSGSGWNAGWWAAASTLASFAKGSWGAAPNEFDESQERDTKEGVWFSWASMILSAYAVWSIYCSARTCFPPLCDSPCFRTAL